MIRLLDLFCGAGGCAKGYSDAGFDVTGIDNVDQKRYPYKFIKADAMEYLKQHWKEYDVIHASPVCKRYSSLNGIHKIDHPDYIPGLRTILITTGKPYVIENVKFAPLLKERVVMLCGTQFGLRIFRHRYFESNIDLKAPDHISHREQGLFAGKTSRAPKGVNQVYSIYGHFSGVDGAREAMGIDWMVRDELAQAIPPAYTYYIGKQILDFIMEKNEQSSL